jgi:hypothetical protein
MIMFPRYKANQMNSIIIHTKHRVVGFVDDDNQYIDGLTDILPFGHAAEADDTVHGTDSSIGQSAGGGWMEVAARKMPEKIIDIHSRLVQGRP